MGSCFYPGGGVDQYSRSCDPSDPNALCCPLDYECTAADVCKAVAPDQESYTYLYPSSSNSVKNQAKYCTEEERLTSNATTYLTLTLCSDETSKSSVCCDSVDNACMCGDNGYTIYNLGPLKAYTTITTPTIAPTTTASSTSATSTIRSKATATRPATVGQDKFGDPQSGSRLSTGSKAGLGVGITIACLALIAIGFFAFRRWKQKQLNATSNVKQHDGKEFIALNAMRDEESPPVEGAQYDAKYQHDSSSPPDYASELPTERTWPMELAAHNQSRS